MVDIVNIALLHFIAIDEKFMLRKVEYLLKHNE